MSAPARPPLVAVAAEGFGTALLVAAVVGSGVMAERLAGGNAGLALLANSLATGAALVALILTYGEVSGAHFNPVVTLVAARSGDVSWRRVPGVIVAQLVGGVLGTVLAHVMFELPLVTVSSRARGGTGAFVSEVVATFGLVMLIRSCTRHHPRSTPFAVAAYIIAAYWFTASTSFANPAVTLARCLSDTFTGIRPADVPSFVAAQLLGGAAAVAMDAGLAGQRRPASASEVDGA